MKRLDIKTFTDGHCVSTVEMPHEITGIDFSFETMIFVADKNDKIVSYSDVYCARYKTKVDAKMGHLEAIVKLRSGKIYS